MQAKKNQSFEIEDLGIQEMWVYDIEVDEDHNFFANDILVHNSNYLNLAPLIDKFFTEEQQKNEQEKIINFIDKLFKEKVEPYIDKCFEELADYMNAYEQRMFMKREVIAPIGVWVAKKRYALMVADSEGVRTWPNMVLKITGLDAKKAEFPKFCREWMTECYEISMMQGEKELQERVKKAKKDFMALPVEQIAAPKGVNGLEKYSDPNTIYTKGTPKHVKAALNHNYLVRKLGLNILPIQSGEKLLFVELKRPNPYNMEVIAFQKELPKEFGLHKYVDYESNYNKNFIEPLKNFIDTLNFSPEIRPSVLDWF